MSAILVHLEVAVEDADDEHPTGMTNEAYERLTNALAHAGFEYHDIERES